MNVHDQLREWSGTQLENEYACVGARADTPTRAPSGELHDEKKKQVQLPAFRVGSSGVPQFRNLLEDTWEIGCTLDWA